jgi:hypothetical protein
VTGVTTGLLRLACHRMQTIRRSGRRSVVEVGIHRPLVVTSGGEPGDIESAKWSRSASRSSSASSTRSMYVP